MSDPPLKLLIVFVVLGWALKNALTGPQIIFARAGLGQMCVGGALMALNFADVEALGMALGLVLVLSGGVTLLAMAMLRNIWLWRSLLAARKRRP